MDMRPSLLPGFAATLNEERRKDRDAHEEGDRNLKEAGEPPSRALRRLAERVNSRPKAIVETTLTAIAEVRERVGDEK
jgi:hypothetical protein